MKIGRRARTRAAAAGAFVLSVAVFCWAWGSAPLNLRERVFPKNLAQVEPWLYRSGQIRGNLIEDTLRDLDIDLIVDLGVDLGDRDPAQLAEKRAAQKLGIEIRRYAMQGNGIGEVEAYAEAIRQITNAGRDGKRVLVHCRAGDRRTGGVLAAYKLLVRRDSAAEAFAELERFRQNRGAPSKLNTFLAEHMDDIARRLLEMGVIASVPDPLPPLASL
jgi:protein-tyrosine phosphatase